jgi:acetyl esterase/lipase
MKKGLIISLFLVISTYPIVAQVKRTVIPMDTTYTPYQTWLSIRGNYPQATIARYRLPEGVLANENLIYCTLKNTPYGDRDLHLDLFRPAKPGKYPLLVMIHGGGWRSGNKSMQVPMAQRIASKGFVTAAVEYQLSLEAKYPAAVYNIKAAIRWLRANADKYGIDTAKITISGCSAGGQLAALTGMTNGLSRFEGDQGETGFKSDVDAIIDIDGVLDFLAPSSLNLIRKPDSPDIEWLGGSFSQKPDTWKEASSIFWVNAKSVPVQFLNSGYSRFHSGQDEMIGMMKELNIYTEVHKFDVQIHPFWLFNPWMETATDYMVEFMKKVLK